jgi:hypothetical protein
MAGRAVSRIVCPARQRIVAENVGVEAVERSPALMTVRHLRRLAAITVRAHEDLCRIRPELQRHLLAGCLAQGDAAHYVYRRGGVKDLDVCLFYASTRQGRPAPYRLTVA